MISHKERQQAKFDREQAELAAHLQQPFLLSSEYNCAFWEERIWDKSWNTGHELASFCYQMIMQPICIISMPSELLPDEATPHCLLKAFFIPSSMSWHPFQSQLLGLVFLLFFNLKMTTLLSQHAMSPRLLENRWHCSRRHFYFKEFNKFSSTEYWRLKSFLNIFLSIFFTLFQHQAILAIMSNIAWSPLRHTCLILFGEELLTSFFIFTKKCKYIVTY